MMATQTRRGATGRELPTDLSPTGKLVYLYLVERGRATSAELKRDLGIPQIRLYPALESLEHEDLVERAGGRFGVPR